MPNPRPFIKPVTKITSGQWKRLLERVVLRQEGKAAVRAGLPAEELGGQAVESVLGAEPVNQRVYGRLYGQIDLGGETLKRPMDYPWPEAVARYIQGKGALSAESRKLPSAKILRPPSGVIEASPEVAGRASGLAPEEKLKLLEGKGSYEERIYRPIKPVAKKIQPAVEEAERERKKQMIQQARKLRPVKKSIERVKKGKVELQKPGSEELVNQALMLDQMWKFIGGKRSLTGKAWDMWRKSAPGRRKVSDARDYFYRVGLKWMEDPKRTARTYPREVKSLETIWKELMEAYGGSK